MAVTEFPEKTRMLAPGHPRARYLVMGFATNQSAASIRIFCRSLRAVYGPGECDIRIITNRDEPCFRELRDIGVSFESTPNTYSPDTGRLSKAANRIVLHAFRLLDLLNGRKWVPEISEAYPVLIETWHHPQLARWFAYRRVLSVGHDYRQIFVADVKDVVFQAPFFEREPEEKVTLFADASLYGNCFWNDKWYREAYGRSAFAKVVGRQPICIGTVLATPGALLDMLREFTAQMARAPFGRIEQAIFNHMLHTGLLRTRLEVTPNIAGPVATLGSEDARASIRIVDGTMRRASDGGIIPVVHMFDRWADTYDLFASRYARTDEREAELAG